MIFNVSPRAINETVYVCDPRQPYCGTWSNRSTPYCAAGADNWTQDGSPGAGLNAAGRTDGINKGVLLRMPQRKNQIRGNDPDGFGSGAHRPEPRSRRKSHS